MKVHGPRCQSGTCCNTASFRPVVRYRIAKSIGFGFPVYEAVDRPLSIVVCNSCRKKKFGTIEQLEERGDVRAMQIGIPGNIRLKELVWQTL